MEFRITFGLKYKNESHPVWKKAHPYGWLTVIANDAEEARSLVNKHLTNDWAFIYTPDDFKYELHPLGELGIIVSTQQCPWCEKSGSVLIEDADGLRKWLSGENFVQNIEGLTSGECELLLSETHEVCWDKMFPPD